MLVNQALPRPAAERPNPRLLTGEVTEYWWARLYPAPPRTDQTHSYSQVRLLG